MPKKEIMCVNVDHLINFLQYRTIPGFLLSLDIFKAFDTFSWDYRISALYSCPTASVKYTRYRSWTFYIAHGTGQGCHLSPIHFILAIDHLASAIRNNTDIMGLDYKINLFADDTSRLMSSHYQTNKFSHSLPPTQASESTQLNPQHRTKFPYPKRRFLKSKPTSPSIALPTP